MKLPTQVSGKTIALGVGLSVVGALATHLWTRYRNRIVRLRWTVQLQRIAVASDDAGWGRVQILYDGNPMNNLHSATVQVQNTSSRDLANVRISLRAIEGTVVLRSVGYISGSFQAFPYAPDYAKIISDAATRQLTPQEYQVWSPRADFDAPVLNRGTVAEFTLLLGRNDYASPEVAVYCDHLGVALLHKPLEEETWGVRDDLAAGAGLLVGALGTAALILWGASKLLIGAVAFLAGALALFVGAGVVRLTRSIANLVD